MIIEVDYGKESRIGEMTVEELKEYLSELEQQLAELDAREPQNEESEAYDDWADEHEDLEDLIDEVKDRLDDLVMQEEHFNVPIVFLPRSDIQEIDATKIVLQQAPFFIHNKIINERSVT